MNYYAIVRANADLSSPAPIMGWDTADETTCVTPTDYKAILLPDMTAEAWTERLTTPQTSQALLITQHGPEIVAYAPPQPVVSLQDQAQAQMQAVMQTAQKMGWGMFNPMPVEVAAYGKALAAIADSTDITSAKLPEVPEALAGVLAD